MNEYEPDMFDKILKIFQMNIQVSKEIDAILEELKELRKAENQPTTHLPTTNKDFLFRRN